MEEAIKWAVDNSGYLMVETEEERSALLNKAEEMGVTIPIPKLYSEYHSNLYPRKVTNVERWLLYNRVGSDGQSNIFIA